jgi:DNA processing protein
LARENITLISTCDPEYPYLLLDGMKGKSPPILYCRGNVRLLSKPAVGFCGSRKASQKGIETAQDCAEQLAQQGFVIASGYADGVDTTTHVSALAAGGATVVVLPEGISHFRVKQEVKEFWDWERVVVVSQFEPKVQWSVHNAMTRNSVICGLSKAMILIEAGTTGGSIAAGRTCLEMVRPLFAPVYEGQPETAAGNRILLKEGAHPIGKSRHTNRAAIDRICEVIGNSDVSKDTNEQISLFA